MNNPIKNPLENPNLTPVSLGEEPGSIEFERPERNKPAPSNPDQNPTRNKGSEEFPGKEDDKEEQILKADKDSKVKKSA